MHFRRLRELYDLFYDGNRILNRFDALTRPPTTSPWMPPRGTRPDRRRNRLIDGIQERRDQITAHTNATEIPTSQSANPVVVLNEIQYAPGPDGSEYLEAHNPSATEAVDLSGWTVPPSTTMWLRQGRYCRPSTSPGYRMTPSSPRPTTGSR